MAEITDTIAEWLASGAISEIKAVNEFTPFGVMSKDGQRQFLLVETDPIPSPKECIDQIVETIDQHASSGAIQGAGLCWSGRVAGDGPLGNSRMIFIAVFAPGQRSEMSALKVISDGPGESASFGDLERLGTNEDLGGAFPELPAWSS